MYGRMSVGCMQIAHYFLDKLELADNGVHKRDLESVCEINRIKMVFVFNIGRGYLQFFILVLTLQN